MAMISPLLKISLLLLAGQHALGEQTQERTAFNSADGGFSGDVSGGSGGSGSSSKGSKKSRGKGGGKGKGKGGSKGGGTTEDPSLPTGIFMRTVFVDFEGLDTDPNDFSLVGPSALEMEFLNTYNALSTEFCDIDGIEILTALIQTDDSGEYIIQRGGNKYSLEFQVMANCDNCDVSTTTLFDHSLDTSATNFFGRKLQWGLSTVSANGDTSGSSSSKSSKKGSKKSSKKSSKRASTTSGSRICTSSNPLFRAPTEEEFLEGYSSALRINSADDSSSGRRLGCDFLTGGRIAVDQVIRAYEMSDVACAGVVEEFDVPVTVELFGDYEAVTDGEKEELEQAFVQNYNALQAYRCDSPSFRTLQSAEIKMVSPDGDTTFTYIFDVKGTCRGTGCSDEPRIFDDDSTRLRRLQNSTGDLLNNSTCSCPVSAEEQGPPKSEEMKILFDETIGELRDCGAVENVLGVGNVGEMSVDFTSAPSAAPDPSVAPSSVPSTAPSTSVQPSLSAAPTGEAPTLSSSPSVASAEPSLSPSISSAPSTSAQPSSVPSISSAPSISAAPSLVPTEAVVPSISSQPSVDPTGPPSTTPSLAPSLSIKPSDVPSVSLAPSAADASAEPSALPSVVPSAVPSTVPSITPSLGPSTVPSITPSLVPSTSPSITPSLVPSTSPSNLPSQIPSNLPSEIPTEVTAGAVEEESKLPSTIPSISPSIIEIPPVVPANDGGTVTAGAVEEEDYDDDWDDDEWDDDWDDDEWDDDWDDDEWDDDWDDDEWDDDVSLFFAADSSTLSQEFAKHFTLFAPFAGRWPQIGNSER
jgi:hypothetical protein